MTIEEKVRKIIKKACHTYHQMTNAAKWKEFLRWWDENREFLPWLKYSTQDTIVGRIERKIKKLQEGDNARQ